MKPPTEVIDDAASATLVDAARILGRWCLQQESLLLGLRGDPDCRAQMSAFAADVQEHGGAVSPSIVDGSDSLAGVIEPLRGRLARVVEEPLRPLALLHALCLTGLGLRYARTQDVITLVYGDPFPLVARSVPADRPPLTPGIVTNCLEELLAGTGFRLYDRGPERHVQVALDYRHRTVLEEATWSDPDPDRPSEDSWGPVVMSSLHPNLSFEDDITYDMGDDSWFWVRPREVALGAILENLEAAAGEDPPAAIAVLPELCLDTSAALADALAADPGRYPRLVVAGSAHEELAGPVRRNVSRTYLDGVEILEQRKHHRLLFHTGDGDGRPEDITRERVVLRMPSGDTTRLAVNICADLHDAQVQACLEWCGVNLLLSPSMTPTVGGFASAVSRLAGSCQAVSLVVNTVAPATKKNGVPFLVLLGLPLQDPDDQSRSEPSPITTWQVRGMLYPGRPEAADRVEWRAWKAEPVAD